MPASHDAVTIWMYDRYMDSFGCKFGEDAYVVSGFGTVSSILADRITHGTTFGDEVITSPCRPATDGMHSVNSAEP